MRGTRWIALAGLAAACGSKGPGSSDSAQKKQAWQLAAPQAAPADDVVVAKVNGKPVFASCVKNQAEGLGLDRDTALQECVDFELLAQAAQAAEMHTNSDVQRTAKQELVRVFVHERYGIRGPEDIPDDLVRRLWDQTSVPKYNHPELRDIVFCRIPLTPEQGIHSEEFKAGLKFLLSVYDELKDKRDVEKNELFAPCYKRYEAAGVHKLKLNTFQLRPKKEYAPAFHETVFGTETAGVVRPPLHTRFGLDLILITEIVPEKVTSYEEAEPALREALFTVPVYEAERDALFETWYAPFAESRAIKVFYDRLPGSRGLPAKIAPPREARQE